MHVTAGKGPLTGLSVLWESLDTTYSGVCEAEANSVNLINRRAAKEPTSSWKVQGSIENFLQNAFFADCLF